MTTPVVRRATLADAAAIAEVQVASWRATYRGLMPDRLIDEMTVEERTGAWRGNLGNQAIHAWVAEEDGRVVGFASVAPSESEPALGELGTLYLHPDAWGRGLGRALLAAAIEGARPRWRELALWVLVGNARAIRFYEAAGWRIDGTGHREWRGEKLPHLRYRLVLAAPAAAAP